jgi:dipeptidyl aminopeptidase/acylaminoacyl peptidase
VFNHIKANISYIDTDRAIAGGASFGCYMTNWIQGHALGREFKALVCHDGKVNQVASYSTDELWFIQRDNNGTIWNDRTNYEQWDPLIHSANFSTPELVIHSKHSSTKDSAAHSLTCYPDDLDYRVLISEVSFDSIQWVNSYANEYQGLQTFNILQSLGVPSRFLHFPDEGHWVTKRDNSLLWHKTIFDWIRFYAGIDKELNQQGVIHQ